MIIEEATINELDEMCDLLAHLFTQEVDFVIDRNLQRSGLINILKNPWLGTILLGKQDGIVIGMVSLLFTVSTALGGRVAILEDMILRPEFRGKKLGSKLLEAAILKARESGCLRITLLTDGVNQDAQRFYENHGFVHSEMITMRLSLI